MASGVERQSADTRYERVKALLGSLYFYWFRWLQKFLPPLTAAGLISRKVETRSGRKLKLAETQYGRAVIGKVCSSLLESV